MFIITFPRRNDMMNFKNKFKRNPRIKVHCDILPRLKRRGLPLAKASSQFSFDSTNVLSISELTPCVPRFWQICLLSRFAPLILDWLQVTEVNLSEFLIIGGMIPPNPFSFHSLHTNGLVFALCVTGKNGNAISWLYPYIDYIKREFDEKIEKTAQICYNENNHKLKATERRFFLWNK